MAGLGRKVFTAGEVLTAANVNGYLMDQTVMVFANSTARASAIATASAGMVTYITGATRFETYTGTGWAPGNDVMVFADASARSSAIGTPAAGMATYLTGVSQFQVYNGSAWTQISGSGGGPDFLLMGA
jgi:hypothetical protein